MATDSRSLQGNRSSRVAVWVAFAFLLSISLVTAIALERERRLLVDQARDEAGTLSALFQENTARTFDGVDTALVGVAAYLSTVKPGTHDARMRETMRRRLEFIPTVRALFVIGPDGFLIHDTDYPQTPAVSLADRPYFREYLDNEKLERSMSDALQSRSGTGWFVAATRRVSDENGKLLGVAVAAVQLDSISRLYRKMNLKDGQQVSLLRSNGTLLARHPGDDAAVGRSFAQFPVFSSKLLQQRSGTFITDGPPWDYERIVSYRALDTQPLVVIVTSRMETVLAAWRRTAAAAAGALLVLAVVTAGAALLYLQRQRERERALRHREAAAAAAALAEANAKFRAFFEQGSLFGCVLDPQGDVLEANQTAQDDPSSDGRKFWERGWWSRPASQAQVLQDGFWGALRGNTFRRELAFVSHEGAEPRLLELLLSPVRGAGDSVIAVAAVGVDITERKHQEEKLRTLARDLSDVDRRRSEFLATLSHELRNVLAPAQNCAEIIRLAEPGSTQAANARRMLGDQFRQMRRLIDDLLDVSRIDSGKVHLAMQAMDLRDAISQAAATAHTAMARANHRFEMALPEEPLPVHADGARMQQVFVNLLVNAAKYTPPGGHVRLRARREGFEAVVEIVDDGLGIPVEAQSRVFEMFEQVGGHASSRQGGLGIGLGLVSKIVALHHGHVEVFSEGAGHGSTFTVYLPLAGAPGPVRGETSLSTGAGDI